MKVFCYDRACNSFVENFEIISVKGDDGIIADCVTICGTWSTGDVTLYVKKIDYDDLKQKNKQLKEEIEGWKNLCGYSKGLMCKSDKRVELLEQENKQLKEALNITLSSYVANSNYHEVKDFMNKYDKLIYRSEEK